MFLRHKISVVKVWSLSIIKLRQNVIVSPPLSHIVPLSIFWLMCAFIKYLALASFVVVLAVLEVGIFCYVPTKFSR